SLSGARYGLRRALPSFPTRRSSDLMEVPEGLQRHAADGALGHAGENAVAQFGEELRRDARHAIGEQQSDRHCDGDRGGTAGRGRDRKSTRLNSSHVKISYAVFCLKK